MKAVSTSKKANERSLNIYAIMMIRNEADIILPVLNHAIGLFNKVIIVDVQSTDGTSESIKSFSSTTQIIELYSCNTQERYQSVMMNMLAAKAVGDGADWIFFLDGDEFINVEGRSSLEGFLQTFHYDVMHMPWINLLPSNYGTFASFDIEQKFYWSGRVSTFNKIALSSLYIANNPQFVVHEGNHNVSPRIGAELASVNLGLALLHLPVRSAERLKYRLSNGLRLLGSKHNSTSGEGNHAAKILNLIADGRVNPDRLNVIAANYGVNENKAESLNPMDLRWPSKFMPDLVSKPKHTGTISRGLSETLSQDAILAWRKPTFVKGSAVKARLVGPNIQISCQSISGGGDMVHESYARLPTLNPDLPSELDLRLLIDSIGASFLNIKILTFSAWSKLIPVLFSIFSVLRPRRFVELGVHNGMSFFAGCQVVEHLGLKTQCVAVDSWIGDPHASLHSREVFEKFRSTLKNNFPTQHYIQGYFIDASQCFDDGSIDLLHIDGFHTYAAVRDDFETWLSKMSESGVILFHDINVHERGFEVWRFWEELKEKYPSFSFFHCHGLGILYVGNQSNSILELFALMNNNSGYRMLAQKYFESLGELAMDYRTLLGEKHLFAAGDVQVDAPNQIVAHQKAQVTDKNSVLLRVWQKIGKYFYTKNSYEDDIKTIKKSGMFDSNYYLSTYTDVRDAGVDPIVHYVSFGARELRNPNMTFDTAGYLRENGELLDTNVNPFAHYLKRGNRNNVVK